MTAQPPPRPSSSTRRSSVFSRSRRQDISRLIPRLWIWLLVFVAFAAWHDLGPWVRQALAQNAPAAEEQQGAQGTTDAEGEDAEVTGENRDETPEDGGNSGSQGSDDAHGEEENHGGGGHADPVAPVLAAIVLILLLAKLGGDLFERFGMPAVLGELVVGIVLGNFALLTGSEILYDFFHLPHAANLEEISEEGILEGTINENILFHREDITPHDIRVALQHVGLWEDVLKLPKGLNTELDATGAPLGQDQLRRLYLARSVAGAGSLYNTAAILKILAGIGVILLLFEVGLESTVHQMMSVGVSSLLVALLGVVAPLGLGWAVGWWLVPPDDPATDWQVHAFIGATLCATSVGITARVLKDLGRSQQRESQIILGAAVIDDVLGLVVLAVVSGVIQQGNVELGGLLKIIGLSFGFLFGAIVLGSVVVTRPLFKAASALRGHGMLTTTALVICFGFAYLANLVGLAPIVGAFAAGLILEGTHYRELGQRENHSLEEALAPLTALLVPIFFVQMGTQVDLASFANPSVWGLAAAVTVAAVIGKQVCSLGVREPGMNRLAVGLGMIPRGEVGLIFAQVGKDLRVHGQPVIDNNTFSAVVVMVMLTTMVTPPLLKWALSRGDRENGGAAAAPESE